MKKVLIVDDSATNVMTLTNILRHDYVLETASSGFEALRKVIENTPDIILLDIIMPEMDGFEVISRLKQMPEAKNIPVIFITGLNDTKNEEKGLALGAIDYISKPFSPKTVKARVNTYIQLFEYQRSFEELVWLDFLTGIHNRRAYDKYIESEWRRAKRCHAPISLAFIDIDFYKEYNDQYGHLLGDDLLKIITSAITAKIGKEENYLARYGGDEFAIIMPSTNLEKGQALAEDVQKSIRDLKIAHSRSEISDYVTISIGGATAFPKKEDDLAKFVNLADKMLYQTKGKGKNNISWSKFYTVSNQEY